MKIARTVIGAATLSALLLLTGCGSDNASSGDTTSAAEESPDTQAGGPAGGQPGGFDAGQIEKINECLEAAGLDVALPTDVPTDVPTERPTDLPKDFDPESMDPEDLPEGMPTDGPGGAFGAMQDPEVQAALKACGIDLPQRPAP